MYEKPTYEELERRVQELEKAETERKQAEAILKEIISKNPMSIQILDKEGCTLEVNPSYKSLFGSVPPSDYSIFNDLQLLQKGMGKLFDRLKSGEVVRFPDLYFNAHDSLPEFPDTPAWVRTIGFPLYGIGEKSEKFVFMHENITDRKQAEQTLKESEERFRTLMEDVDAIAVQGYGPDGLTQYWNTASERLYGYSQQEVIGRNLLDLIIPPEMKDDVAKAIHEMAESGQPIPSGEVLLMHKDGSRIPVISHHAIIKIPGREQELFCLDVDITERKRAEEALSVSEERLDLAMAVKNEGIWDWNLSTNDTIFDDRYYTMAGYSPGEFPQNFTGWAANVHPDDLARADAAIKAYLSGQSEVFDIEFRFRHKDGSWMWIQGRGKIVKRDENGYPLRMIGTHTDITTRKRVEEALRESEKKYKSLTNNLNVGIFRNTEGSEGKFLEANPAIVKMFGFDSREEFLKLKVSELYKNPSDRKKYNEKILKDGAVKNEELKLQKKDGTSFTCSVSAVAVKTEENKIRYYDGIIEDVTEKKQTEEKLRLFKESVENSSEAVGMSTPEGKHYYQNKAFDELFGEIGENPPETLYVDHGVGHEVFRTIMAGGQWTGEVQMNARDGSILTILLRAYVSKDKRGRITALVGVHTDITERKQMEVVLRESELTFRKLFEESSDAILLIDETGVFAECNQAALDLLKMTREQFLFLPPVKISPEFQPNGQKSEKAALEMIELAYKKGLHRFDWTCVNSEGVEFIVEVSLMPIVVKGKTMLHTTWRNITERKQAEAEKLIAQKNADDNEKMALVGRIAGKMAHDFNNILGIVMGNTELALLDCLEPNTKKTLELIYEQTMRGKNLTKNLVVFAKDQEPKQEFFSINEKMDLVLNLLKKDLEGINVLRQYERGTPELLADPGMMEHAIVNLVQNSIHAVSLVEQPEILVRTYHQGETIFLEIEDNGCGIPPEFLGEIFEPSFTLKGSKDKSGMYKPGIKGTGYGMSNVKRYIEQHKGDISIHSEVQIGTKVTIKLPVIKKELTFEEIANVKKEKIFFEKHILVVEDEQAILDVQYRILSHEPCNHKVDIANNGQVAIDLLNRNEYDLISLDYVLPGKFNGMDVYHHLREKNKNVPVLFISGNIEFLESIKELKKHDLYVDHLSKPCKNIDYVNCINKLFGIVAI